MSHVPRLALVLVLLSALPGCSDAAISGKSDTQASASEGGERAAAVDTAPREREGQLSDEPQMVSGAFLIECEDAAVAAAQRTIGCGVTTRATGAKRDDATLLAVTVRIGDGAPFSPALTPTPAHPRWHATFVLDARPDDDVAVTEARIGIGGVELQPQVSYATATTCAGSEARVPGGACEPLVAVTAWRNLIDGSLGNAFVAATVPTGPGYDYSALTRDAAPSFRALAPLDCPAFACVADLADPSVLPDGTVPMFEIRYGALILTGGSVETMALTRDQGWQFVRMAFRVLPGKWGAAEPVLRFRRDNAGPVSWTLAARSLVDGAPADHPALDGPVGWGFAP